MELVKRSTNREIGRSLLLGLGLVAAATALRFALAPLLGNAAPFATYFPAVALAGWYGGWRAGVIVCLLGYAAAEAFFLNGGERIFPHTPEHWAASILYIAICGMLVWITWAAHSAQRLAERRANEALAGQIRLRDLLKREHRIRQELESANRIKDDFLSTISHELRTPLNSVLALSRMLGRPGSPPDEVRDGLKMIEKSAKIQVEIISDLLDMSKILGGQLTLRSDCVDLTATTAAAIDTVRVAAEAKQISIDVSIDQVLLRVVGDAVRIQQVVWNLLSNAVKFTRRGGIVRVVLQHTTERATVVVADNGEGIRPEYLPHVFDRFTQADSSTRRRHTGLGLGLAITKELVELHGGTIKAESEGTGKGATFTVEFPIAPSEILQKMAG